MEYVRYGCVCAKCDTKTKPTELSFDAQQITFIATKYLFGPISLHFLFYFRCNRNKSVGPKNSHLAMESRTSIQTPSQTVNRSHLSRLWCVYAARHMPLPHRNYCICGRRKSVTGGTALTVDFVLSLVENCENLSFSIWSYQSVVPVHIQR